MTRSRILGLVAVIAIAAVAVLAYSFFRTPEEASAPIAAPTIAAVAATEAPPIPTDTPIPAAQPDDSPLPTPSPEPEPTNTPEPEQEPAATPEPEPTDTPEPEPEPATGPAIFEIVQAESEARFLIDEVLRGEDKIVVGATDQVAGQIAIDASAPANSQIGTILVNARTITTDSSFRNRAIKNRILLTDEFEFVTFEPTALSGLPAAVNVGDSFDFEITGNLTVTDETREVTFAATVTAVSATRIEGLASVSILWADFGLSIPAAQAVDSVEDDLILELEFVAEAVGE